ncbi:MAG: pseudouridine synthase [Chitinivibrionales bacterium]|nr:pseudouridine synthase [Chitinivibrionales bacterium]
MSTPPDPHAAQQSSPPPGAHTDAIRLNKYLAQCGLGARRKCDEFIAKGHICINGQKVTQLGTKINPRAQVVTWKGKELAPVTRLEYLAYHKPRGPLVTRCDPHDRDTIYTSCKKNGIDIEHLTYIGRLDRDSEGLLLLTNDGNINYALTHPRFHIKKVYRIRTDKPLAAEHRRRMLESGVSSRNQTLRAGAVRTCEGSGFANEYWYEIDLYEGKNRQIRRMFEALDYAVLRLKRIQFGSVKLEDLKRSAVRKLTAREIAGLKNTGHRIKN